MICTVCRTHVDTADTGRPRLYCSRRCQQRAYRMRRNNAKTIRDLNDERELINRVENAHEREWVRWLKKQSLDTETARNLYRAMRDDARIPPPLP